jgi:hypothetical protein
VAVVSDRDRGVLEFAAAQRFVTTSQVAALLHGREGGGRELLAGAGELLAAVVGRGLLKRDRLAALSDRFRITAAGLRVLGSAALPPAFDSRHQQPEGAGWLWLSAHAGSFGPARRFLSERQMRAEDQHHGVDAPFAVEPGKFGGRSGLHYADLMVLLESGGRLPIELMLAVPGVRQLEAVMRAYAADARTDGVLYLVLDPWARRLLETVIASLELLEVLHVRYFRLGEGFGD